MDLLTITFWTALYIWSTFLMIGENILLKLRLKVENYEHQVDDLKAYIKQLEKKLKKYENNNTGTSGNR